VRLSAGIDRIEAPLTSDYPTTLWRKGDVWRTRHHLFVNCRALDGVLPVTAQLVDEAGTAIGRPWALGEIRMVADRQFSAPSHLTGELDVRLSNVGRLVGYRLDKQQIKSGENLQVTLYWRAEHEIDRNLSVFVHLSDGQVRAQHDSWPAGGNKPTSTWALGEVVEDRHLVAVGPEVAPGSYGLFVGMYDAANLEPVAAIDAHGQKIEGGRVPLQSITVAPP
jgi:hypothetical protein